jgi:hypothetical protein
MEQSPIKANSSSTNKEISHKEPKCSSSRSQESATCPCREADHSTPPPYFLKIHFYIILTSTPRSLKWFLSLRFPHQIPVCTCPVPHTFHVTHPSHCFYLITRITLDEEYSSWSSSLCCLLQSPVMLSVLDTNIFLDTLFSNALSLRSSPSVKDPSSATV